MEEINIFFLRIKCFKYFGKDYSHKKLIIDSKSYYYRTVFVINNLEYIDKETTTKTIYDLESGSIVKLVDVSNGYVDCDIYSNQLYYSSDNDFLAYNNPTKIEIDRALELYKRHVLEEQLISKKKLVRINGTLINKGTK